MAEEHVSIVSFDNNPNIGLYAFATDEYCLIGEDVPDKHEEELHNILKVPIYRITIAGTGLIGAFCAGNSNCLLVPEITFKHELQKLDELGIHYKMIYSKLTALGNNVAVNNHAAIVNPEFSDGNINQLQKVLNVPVKRAKISDLDTVGSCISITNKGALVHRDIKSFEMQMLEDIFGFEILEGSVNMGNPYIHSGIIANSNGFLIGGQSGGPEINNADEALGFLNNDN